MKSSEKTNENAEMTIKLMDRALAGEHSQPCVLNSLAEYIAAKSVKKAIKKVVIFFKKTSDNLFNDYLKNIANHIEDTNMLISCAAFRECYDFYVKEYNIAFDAIDDFENFAVLHPIQALFKGRNSIE